MPISSEEAANLMQKHKADIDALRQKEQATTSDDIRELIMLERRTMSEYLDADLGHGDKIRLRACLSDEETKHLHDLTTELQDKEHQPSAERQADIIYEIIATVTHNELLTVEWLRSHKDAFSTADALAIYYISVRMAVERALETAKIQNFRPEPHGKEIR